jgi:hypothetical protein
MTKTLTALATAATIAIATVATPTTADARWGWRGGAFIGGLAAAAIIGGALSRPYYYGGYGYGSNYGYDYGYYPQQYYYAPAYSYAPAPAYYYGAPGPYYGNYGWRRGYRYRW